MHWEGLRRWFGECPFAVVALSGGVDSSLVSFLAHRFLGEHRNVSVISDSPSLKRSDLDAATAFCCRYGIPLEIIHTQELNNPAYASNPTNRCFYCKQTLYDDLQSVATLHADSWVLNGTNVDDLGDYRPGLKAAGDFRVRSPLSECGLDKTRVRKLARSLDLVCWDKPASPCLSSRIPYGQPVTIAKLRQIEAAEETLRQAGFPIARFRHFGPEGCIEVPAKEMARLQQEFASIEPALLKLGFDRVKIDPEGFVSGKLNRGIAAASGLPVIRLAPNHE